jgi:hypothetical protein
MDNPPTPDFRVGKWGQDVEGFVTKSIRKLLNHFGYEIARIPFKFDLAVVDYLQDKDTRYLSDAEFLEGDLLPRMGLNNEILEEIPEELFPFCGCGLYSWQYPNQFAKYLAQLSKFKVSSYLEIGVHRGGTFIITVEYLRRFHPMKYAVGIDIETSPLLLKYCRMNRNVGYMLVDSGSLAFRELIENHPGFDLVLIDGDHEEVACENDFETVREKASICVLHDITSDSAPGPGKVWNKIKSRYSHDYVFFEYTDQYESVRRRTGKRYLGIGMAVRKHFIETKIHNLIEKRESKPYTRPTKSWL